MEAFIEGYKHLANNISTLILPALVAGSCVWILGDMIKDSIKEIKEWRNK